jgi:hypothetical protein
MYTRFDYLVKHMPRFMTNACCRNVCLRVRNARLHLAHSTMMMAQHGAQFVRERNSVLCCECAAIDLFAVLRLGASVSVTHMLLPHETIVKLRHFMPMGRSLSSHALHLLNMISIMPTPQQPIILLPTPPLTSPACQWRLCAISYYLVLACCPMFNLMYRWCSCKSNSTRNLQPVVSCVAARCYCAAAATALRASQLAQRDTSACTNLWRMEKELGGTCRVIQLDSDKSPRLRPTTGAKRPP